jgi:hypothetical protein
VANREEKDMEFKIRENNNYELITFKHRVASQAMSLIEDKEVTLYSEVLLYTQLAFVQESCEEDVIDFLNNSMEKDLIDLMVDVVEPAFLRIIEEPKAKESFDMIVDIITDYVYDKKEEARSFVGMLGQLVEFIVNLSNEDFNILFQRGKETINTIKEKPKADRQIEIQNAKMAELINKFKSTETTK